MRLSDQVRLMEILENSSGERQRTQIDKDQPALIASVGVWRDQTTLSFLIEGAFSQTMVLPKKEGGC
jgi:hypothetical protein